MAADKIYAMPDIAAGAAPSAGAGAWGYGAWVLIGQARTDLKIIAVTFQNTAVPSLDTTQQFILDIGIGAAGAEVTRWQVPYSFRMDTAVGYYMDTRGFGFPEPPLVHYGDRVSVRVADSIGGSLAYAAVKIMFQETDIGAVRFNNYLFVEAGGMSVGERIK